MSMSDREQMAVDALKANREQREKKNKRKEDYANGKTGNYEFEKIKYVSLDVNSDAVIRFLGAMHPFHTEPTDMVQVLHTDKALDDYGKLSKINWSFDKTKKTGWFLWKLYYTVMAYNYIKEEKRKEYVNQAKFPEIFNRMAFNNNLKNKYETGWLPDNYLVCNVIDRLDIDWHKTNKHTKLLSKKCSVYNDIEYTDVGITISLYEMILNEIVEYQGYFEKYDIVIRKLADKPYNEVYHPVLHAQQLTKKNPTILKVASVKELTDEERSWEKYDLDKLFKVTSYAKIMNRFGKYIQDIDKAFNKEFYFELEQLCEKEKTDNVKNNKPTESESNDEPTMAPIEEKKSVEPPVETTTQRKTITPKSDEVKVEIDWQEFIDMGLLGITSLTDENKNLILRFNDQGVFDYSCDKSNVIDCAECGFPSPDTFMVCPKCGRKFN